MNIGGPHARTAGGALPLILFSACFVFSYADRYILSLLLPAVQERFAISDTGIGLLQGAGFALVYAVMGLPIARLIDRGNRVKVASACVALWSVASMLSSAAWNFASLLLCRVGVAAAEAGLPPAAISFFRDSREPASAARASSLFMLAPFLGVGVALFGGAWLLDLAASQNAIEPWRLVLFAMSAPGLLLALMLLRFVADAPRSVSADTASAAPSLRLLRDLLAERPGFGLYFIGAAFFALFNNAIMAWYPSVLVRTYDVAPSFAGRIAGPLYMAAGVAGALCSAWLVGRLASRGVAAVARFAALLLAAMVPTAGLMGLAPTIGLSVAFYTGFAFLSAMFASLFLIPVQLASPPALQARSIAALLLSCGVAAAVGTLLVGLAADRLSLSLGTALAAITFPAASAGAIFLFAASRQFGAKGERALA